jgi:hypothetical protein
MFDGYSDVLNGPQRFDTASFGGGRQMAQKSGIAESSGVGEGDSKFHIDLP